MHKGLRYPFHPEYQSTEAWFWPGFLPWRMHGRSLADAAQPWDHVPTGWTGVSDAGVPSNDRTWVDYTFPAVLGGLTAAFKLTVLRTGTLPHFLATWKIRIPATGTMWADATLIQTYPQRIVFASGFIDFMGHAGYGGGLGPFLEFKPATYAQGGSPW